MRRLAIQVNNDKPGAAELAREVHRQLALAGIAVLPASDEAIAAADAVIAIGGDGTILQTARAALQHNKPVLGINAGRLGFLAGLEGNELALLSRLANDDYELDHRMLLCVQVWEGDRLLREESCINDAVVARQGFTHAAEVSVVCDGSELTYLGDGVIFSTPTGSTAYSFSAGGPVVDPRIESILLTPVCNHLLISRSIVFSAKSAFSLEITRPGLGLTIDAELPFVLDPGQRLAIKRCQHSAVFLRLKTEGFLDILNTKLICKQN